MCEGELIHDEMPDKIESVSQTTSRLIRSMLQGKANFKFYEDEEYFTLSFKVKKIKKV